MSAELFMLLDEIEKEKGISRDVVIDALNGALLSAYKKNFGAVQDAKVIIDEETGAIKVYARKNVVEEVENRECEISVEDAQKVNPNYEAGDVFETEVTPAAFGRIAAQTARQVVLQRIREAEREKAFDEFSDRANDIMTATVRKIDRRNIMLEIGDTASVLMPNEQV